MTQHIQLAAFENKSDGPEGESYWAPPSGVSALIDLTPPGQDADPNVNYALMLSDERLPSDVNHHYLGFGDVAETHIDGIGRDAWESVTGFRPIASTIASCIIQHLTDGADPTGLDFSRPLTAGPNRKLEIHLGRPIWEHTISDWNDAYAIPVMRVEAEGLAQIYREMGEIPYRLALGGLYRKYNFYGPVKYLIAWLYPDGRDDLPLMDELWPQTIKTENWPNTGSTGVITSGQDNTWTVILGSWTVPSVGIARAPSNSRARMDYAFASNDHLATHVFRNTSSGPGMVCRSDLAFANFYLALTISGDRNRLNVFNSGSSTVISSGTGASTVLLNDIMGISAVGSSIKWMYNGVANTTVTNTSVASGAYIGMYNSGNGQSDFGQVVGDDFLTGSGITSVQLERGIRGLNRGICRGV